MLIIFDFIDDPERQKRTRAAGPFGVKVYPEDQPTDPWAFELFGFPTQLEAMEKADNEVQRRQRIGWLPKKDA